MKDEIIGFLSERTKTWWLSLLVGILTVFVGFWMVFAPEAAFLAATMLFVSLFFISGICDIVFAFMNRKNYVGWGWTLSGGVIDLLFGVMLVALKGGAAFVLVFYLGIWILFRAVMMLGASINLQRFGIKGWGWLTVAAVVGILMAILSIITPALGATMIVAFIATAFIFYGMFRIFYSLNLKALNKKIKEELYD